MESQTSLADCGKRIVIKPVRSRTLITMIAALHVGAILLLFFADLNPWLVIAVAGLIFFNLWQYFSTEKMNTYGLSLQLGESILLQTNSDTWQKIDVIESFVTSWLIVLKVRTLNDSMRYSLVYAADSMNTQSFRRLRICLNRTETAYADNVD